MVSVIWIAIIALNKFFMTRNIHFLISILILGAISGCNSSKPKKSLENLKAAFISESAMTEKYEKYAQAATLQGLDTLARLFIAVSKSERIHAVNHGKVIEKFGEEAGVLSGSIFEIKTSIENLNEAVKSETLDMQKVYQGYIRNAEQEKAPEIAKTFTWAWNCEKKHLRYFKLASLSLSKGNQKGVPFNWYICSTCGNLYSSSDLKDKCEFCLTGQDKFIGYINVKE